VTRCRALPAFEAFVDRLYAGLDVSNGGGGGFGGHVFTRITPISMLYKNITQTRAKIMHITNLRKVGGSVMLAVPPALLDVLHLQAGATVGLAVDGGRLVVEAALQPRYTMSELLEASDYSTPRSADEQAWLDAETVGGELL
jgi:antitoxin ChpS